MIHEYPRASRQMRMRELGPYCSAADIYSYGMARAASLALAACAS